MLHYIYIDSNNVVGREYTDGSPAIQCPSVCSR